MNKILNNKNFIHYSKVPEFIEVTSEPADILFESFTKQNSCLSKNSFLTFSSLLPIANII